MFMNIYDVLNRMNEEVGYKGLDNTGKTTDERDDVISRQAFNNWLREYNHSDNIKINNGREIKGNKVRATETKYFETDVEKIIKVFKPRLIKEWKKKTVPLNLEAEGFELIDEEQHRRAKTTLEQYYLDGLSEEDIKKAIEERENQIIYSVLDMDKVKRDAEELFFTGFSLYDRNEYIKKETLSKCKLTLDNEN